MTTLSQRLSTLHSERGHLVANFESMLQPSLDEGRDLNETENDAIGLVRERLEGLDKQIESLTAAEALLERQAAPVPARIPGERPGSSYTLATQRQNPHIEMRRRDDYKGATFTRWAIATCVAGPWNAAEYARQRWQDDDLAELIRGVQWYMRAPTPAHIGGPGSMVPPPATNTDGFLVRIEHMGQEFIELLRPMMIVSRIPSMRRLQFNGAGTLLLPRQNGGVAGGYVGEGGNIQVERLTFGQLQLTPSKLAVIVPMTNEILYRSDPGLEMLVRDDMVEGTSRTIDRVFFSTAAGAAGPAGILNSIAQVAGGAFDDTAEPPAAPASHVPVVTNALKNMILALRMANMPFTAPVWIMNARTKEYLRLLRSSIDVFVFKAEIDAGTLLGYPIIESTNIPIPFPPGAAGQTAYALIDASQVIWAEDALPMMDASEHASIMSAAPPPPLPIGGSPPVPATPPAPPGIAGGLWEGGTPYYSAWQNDMVFMRIRMRHTWARRYDVPPNIAEVPTARTLAWSLVGTGLNPTPP